jgi:hypothetical protein
MTSFWDFDLRDEFMGLARSGETTCGLDAGFDPKNEDLMAFANI